MIANLNKDLDVTLTLCHSVSLCMCVCARRWCPPTFLLLCYDWHPRSKPAVNRRCHPRSAAISALLAAFWALTETDTPSRTHNHLNVHKYNARARAHTHTHTHNCISNILLIRHSASIAKYRTCSFVHAHASCCQFSHWPSVSVHVMQTPNKTLSETVSVCQLTWQEQRAVFLPHYPIFVHSILTCPEADPNST